MAKRKDFVDVKEEFGEVPTINLVYDNAYAYGVEVIEQRALPDYRDGLKPVQRKILWAAHKVGMVHSKPTRKVAFLAGEVLGKYHPHATTDNVIVNMANFAEPLLDKQGNFGSADGDPAAASRYIETRLSKLSNNYLLDPKYLELVNMVDNYDGTLKEPIFLPAKLPILLLIGAEGIAVGCTTLIPSYSFDSVNSLVKHCLKKDEKCTPELCCSKLEFKFTYGGVCTSSEPELLEYYKTGSGKIAFAPTVKVEDNEITVTELAPRLRPSYILDTVSDHFKGIKVQNIHGKKCSDWVRIIVKNAISSKEVKSLAKKVVSLYTTNMSLKTTVTVRHSDGEVSFKSTTIPDIVNSWLSWRLKFEVKVVNNTIEQIKDKVQKLNWLVWAVKNRDIVFKALDSKTPKEYLVKKGKITEEHANYILDQQVRRLAKLELDSLNSAVKENNTTIEFLYSEIETKRSTQLRVFKQLEIKE